MKRTETKTIEATVTEVTPVTAELQINEESKKINTAIERISDASEVSLDSLSEEEYKEYTALAQRLNPRDICTVSSYGADLQRMMGDNSKALLATQRASKVGDESMVLVQNLMEQIGQIDLDSVQHPSKWQMMLRKLPIIRSLVPSVKKLIGKLETIEDNVKEITGKVEASRLVALRDNKLLEQQFQNNVKYIEQLEKLIVAAKLKSQEMERGIAEMDAHPENYEPYVISDYKEFKHELDKRISDMLTWRYTFQQSLAQIRIIQKANIMDANNAKQIVDNTIPITRNQLSMAVALYNQQQNIKLHKAVTETANQILKNNADKLQQNAIEVAKANEESVISLDTLQYTTDKLKETLMGIMEAQKAGEAKRKEAEGKLLEMQKELNVLSIATVESQKQLIDASK